MKATLNAAEIKQKISIVTVLTNLGYEPKRKAGKELLYLSMLRDSDTKPSFCVNEDLNTWYDHGMGKGGNIIDFGLLYWKNLGFSEVLSELVKTSNQDVSSQAVTYQKQIYNRLPKAIKVPHYKVEAVKPLGTNPFITDYLKMRGVWQVAGEKLQEVYYFVLDDKMRRKDFFAAGWQNEKGGWEVRNKYFKGCLGPKGMTYIQGSEYQLSVFEGYLNYLSWLFENKDSKDSVLVLNSLAFLTSGIDRAKSYEQVNIYFDHDKSGEEASQTFLKALPDAMDKSSVYAGYNDYNDKIQAELDKLTQKTHAFSNYMTNLKVGFRR